MTRYDTSNPNASEGPPKPGLIPYKGDLWRDDAGHWYFADGTHGGRIPLREFNQLLKEGK
jgi:hypothetical protein